MQFDPTNDYGKKDNNLAINKNPQQCELLRIFLFVARPGFEPRQTEPKSVVLPLYYRAPLLGLQKYNFFYFCKKIVRFFENFSLKLPDTKPFNL